MVGIANGDADGGKESWLGAEHLSGLEALVLAQSHVGENGKSRKKKVKNVYNNKIILILYYI